MDAKPFSDFASQLVAISGGRLRRARRRFTGFEYTRLDSHRLPSKKLMKPCERATLFQRLVEHRRIAIVEVLRWRMAQEHARHRVWLLTSFEQSGRFQEQRASQRTQLCGGNARLTTLQRFKHLQLDPGFRGDFFARTARTLASFQDDPANAIQHP